MRKTIRNVTIVVPVLITSCHVSENLKSGLVAAHTTMIPAAIANAIALPVHLVTAVEKDSSARLHRLDRDITPSNRKGTPSRSGVPHLASPDPQGPRRRTR